MTNNNFSQTAAFIWSVADLLRSDFKQSQYGRVILPFTLLRRLEEVMEESRELVFREASDSENIISDLESTQAFAAIALDGVEERLLNATKTLANPAGLTFFNRSRLRLSGLDSKDIKGELENYISGFSGNIREIFEYFDFDEYVSLLDNANLLQKVVKKFADVDLSLTVISNHEMGLIFEELLHRFAESANETAGDHFTPRDIARLTTSLLFSEDESALTKDGSCTVYDPAAGSGGFLSSSIEHMAEFNTKSEINVFAQEINSESYAICRALMLMKGQDITNIKLGDTLSNDQLPETKFDYILSNPPFGLHWSRIREEVMYEHDTYGFEGRYGAGIPRISDGSLLFLMHMISKMRECSTVDSMHVDGSRIGIILNGSPSFTGGAGSGESEIRRYIFENDLLEAIVALPTDMFYNTGIATYIWILSNKKPQSHKGKVQLIDASKLFVKMRKPLGSKRNVMSVENINTITQALSKFKDIDTRTNVENQAQSYASKIVDIHEFGYRRLTIERPLRLSAQISDEAVQSLRFAPKPFNTVMSKIYERFGSAWTNNNYGVLNNEEPQVRALIKVDFPELSEKQIQKLLGTEIWLFQKTLMDKAKILQGEIGSARSDDYNQFNQLVQEGIKSTRIILNDREQKQLKDAITWKNPEAEPVVEEELQEAAQPIYGKFEYKGKVVKFEKDGDLRDNEDVQLDSNKTTSELIELHFNHEIVPHVNDAWVNAEKVDSQDQEVGLVGYQINFASKFESSSARDQAFAGESHRIKNIVTPSELGVYALDEISGKVAEYERLDAKKRSLNLVRFDINTSILIPGYYNIFLAQDEGSDWLESYFPSVSGTRRISFNSWKNARLILPSVKKQLDLVGLFEECDAVLTRMALLKKSAFNDFNAAQEQIRPFQGVASRYELEFSSMLPTPLAILWELAESKFNGREQCEAFIKFYEYLGFYLVSIAFGLHKPNREKLYRNKKGNDLVGLTMAYGYQRLKEYRSVAKNNSAMLESIYSQEVIDLLSEATSLRNDIAHRGLPSAQSVSSALKRVNSFNDAIQTNLRRFFEESTLIKPMQSRFDGEAHYYEVEILKGLGINPSKTAVLKTNEPMVYGDLYLVNGEIKDNEVLPTFKLFPLIIMDETVKESEMLGFYFYSDQKEDELRYVCPYPNVETYKFKKKELLTGNLNDE